MQGLEGVNVLELGHLASAAYATKLMADLGANVVKAEEPKRRPGPLARAFSRRQNRPRAEWSLFIPQYQ